MQSHKAIKKMNFWNICKYGIYTCSNSTMKTPEHYVKYIQN